MKRGAIMEQTTFYQHKTCKAILTDLDGRMRHCANEELKILTPNTEEASVEKHIPVLTYRDGVLLVQVGSAAHPMTPEHYIPWIFLQTRNGGMYQRLTPEDAPEAAFRVQEADIVHVYAYCNLHGVWQANTSGYHFEQTACSPEFSNGCL